MKKIIVFLIYIGIFAFLAYYMRDELKTLYITYMPNTEKIIKLDYKNEYSRNYNYSYVKKTDDFLVKNKEQILDVYYTILDSGIDEFSFYCSKSYDTCIEDVKSIAFNKTILSNINSFVHPYNSFDNIETQYDLFGKITIRINKNYDDIMIKEINNKVNTIINSLNNKNNNEDKVKYIHDYIIKNSKAILEEDINKYTNYHIHSAYGPLIEGYSLCRGYTDSMAIILDKLNIPNYNVVSSKHTWNAIYINGKWYHIDLTWDDPVMPDKSDILEYDYYLINTEELEKKDSTEHEFDKNVFKELK